MNKIIFLVSCWSKVENNIINCNDLDNINQWDFHDFEDYWIEKTEKEACIFNKKYWICNIKEDCNKFLCKNQKPNIWAICENNKCSCVTSCHWTDRMCK